MKITKHILAACILTGMAACDTDKEIAVFNEDSGAIKINAVIDAAYTRSNPTGTNEQQMQFNNGDQILLSCEDGSVTYMLSGGQWAPTDNYYLRWGNEPVTYSAFYTSITGPMTCTIFPFSISSFLSDGGRQNAADFTYMIFLPEPKPRPVPAQFASNRKPLSYRAEPLAPPTTSVISCVIAA